MATNLLLLYQNGVLLTFIFSTFLCVCLIDISIAMQHAVCMHLVI